MNLLLLFKFYIHFEARSFLTQQAMKDVWDHFKAGWQFCTSYCVKRHKRTLIVAERISGVALKVSFNNKKTPVSMDKPRIILVAERSHICSYICFHTPI